MTELIKAVKNHSGMTEEDLLGVRNANDGYAGFTYYKDTVEFYDEYAPEIWEQLNEVSEQLGQRPTEVISSFGCVDSIVDDETFKNALAWFALEEVARYLQDKEEEKTD